MNLKPLGKALINMDHLLCLQPAEPPNKAIIATFDTGQVVVVEDDDPSTTIRSQCIEFGKGATNAAGTT